MLDFRNVVAKMLGLDVNTLAVADYEIIARIERVISTFNAAGILPVNVQRVETPTPGSAINYEFLSSQYDSNSSIEPRQLSPTRRHHHVHHVREQSASPHRHHQHHHNNHSHTHQQQQHNHSSNHHHVVETHCRQRSKSPRKNVTIIDPNSY